MPSRISGCVYIYDTVSEGVTAITSLGFIFRNHRLVSRDVLKILYTSLVNATILCHDVSIVTHISNRKTGSPRKREVGLQWKNKNKKSLKRAEYRKWGRGV